MPRIPGIHHRDAVRVFEKLGYRIARESGHIIMSNAKVRLVKDADCAAKLKKRTLTNLYNERPLA